MRKPDVARPQVDDNDLSSLPDPMSPEGADLRSFDWFRLYHKRLIRSDFWNDASGEAAKASVYLWCEAMMQVPAGSLPNVDRDLSDYVGFGRRDMTAWHAIKDEVLKAWVLCSDNRLYHPTLCDVVTETWDEKAHTRTLAAQRQARRRERLRAENATGAGENAKVTRDAGDKAARHGQERTGNEKRSEDGEEGKQLALLPVVTVDPLQAAFQAYNELAAEIGIPKAKLLTPARRAHLKKRIAEHGPESWATALQAIKVSSFLRGRNDRSWTADFDFMLQPSSYTKLIEGSYRADLGGPGDGRQPTGFGGGRATRVDRLRSFDAGIRGGADES